MKKFLIALSIIYSFNVFGQTSNEYLLAGNSKQEQGDYKKAIKEYDLALQVDKNNKEAFYNRGNCELALKDYAAATKDFVKTTEIAPTFADAYYQNALVFENQDKHIEAIQNLDKTIELNPRLKEALTLRGKINAQKGNKKSACKDFFNTKQLGDEQGTTYYNQYCENATDNTNSIFLPNWPWDDIINTDYERAALNELMRSTTAMESKETVRMVYFNGATFMSLNDVMNMLFAKFKINAPAAKLTLLEKNETAENPSIVFMIEMPDVANSTAAESQIWQIIQGKTTLRTDVYTIKKSTFPTDKKEAHIKYLKSRIIKTK